jgi:capsular exopolysaccharide synthesis family protein
MEIRPMTQMKLQRGSSSLFKAVAPPDGHRNALKALVDRLGEKVALSGSALPGCVEQYRRLAATLHHAQQQTGLKVVMVTSAMPAEGKTLTATNLALTLSESYRRRVLVIDADLRCPSLHAVFNIPNIAGLNEALTSDVPPPAFEVSSRLTLLPAGRPNADPMGILTSSAMQALLKNAGAGFDWVIVDTPPVGLLTDASLLAGMVDGVVMVVAAGKVSYKIVQRAIDAVGRVRILGVVLNRAAESPFGAGYNYEGYYGNHRPNR